MDPEHSFSMASLTRGPSVASLMKLHLKSKSLDSFRDDRVEHSTTRAAWIEIVDNVERGAYYISRDTFVARAPWLTAVRQRQAPTKRSWSVCIRTLLSPS